MLEPRSLLVKQTRISRAILSSIMPANLLPVRVFYQMSLLAITPLTHLYALRHLFYSLVVLALLFAVKKAYTLPLGIILPVIVLFFAPTLYIHGAYYLRNRCTSVAIFDNRLELTHEGTTVTILFLEIEAIELYAAGGVYRQIDWENYAFQSYHYLKIQYYGQTYYLTSLLARSSLEEVFSHMLTITAERYTRRKRLIASLLN